MTKRAPVQQSGITVGDDVVRRLYSNCDLAVKETQPLLVLHRDTVRSFLHEKLSLLVSESRLLAYFGIEASLISALATATFSDLWVIKASLIQGTFSAFSIIIGLLLIRETWRWWREARGLTPTTLTDDLSLRGALISPKGSGEDPPPIAAPTTPNQQVKDSSKPSEPGTGGAVE